MIIVMNRQSLSSNDLPSLRSIVWIGIVAVTLLFWAFVAAALVVLFR